MEATEWLRYLPRPQAALRDMPDRRSLPLAGKDGLRHDDCHIRASSWMQDILLAACRKTMV
jgi:hypothetical protein